MRLTKLGLASAIVLAGGGQVARAVPVSVDGSTTDNFIGCTGDQISSCYALTGGTPVHHGDTCSCEIYYWVPRQVSNAKNGDVGLVPIAGNDGGDALVRATLSALGQQHRHAVMFYEHGGK